MQNWAGEQATPQLWKHVSGGLTPQKCHFKLGDRDDTPGIVREFKGVTLGVALLKIMFCLGFPSFSQVVVMTSPCPVLPLAWFSQIPL